MTVPRLLHRAVPFALVVLCLATTALAGDESWKLIVNPDNGVTSVSADFVRKAYLKKSSEWSDGTAIRPVDLGAKSAVRARFTKDVLKKTTSQLKSFWNQQIFSGKGLPPPAVDSAADAVAYVLANPGAIGYVPATTDTGRAKVVEVR
jgi:ABC-type phosphate transport system substrate-binding protein